MKLIELRHKIYDLEKTIDELFKEKVLEMVTRRIRNDPSKRGMIVYGDKFRPVMQA